MTALTLPLSGRIAIRPELQGIAWGLTASVIWGAYLAFARSGVVGGLAPLDFALLRYATAGAIMLPFLLRFGLPTLGGIGWPRGFALAALAGPAFILFGTLGYRWAPLAHGAVVQPAVVTIGTMAMAVWLLREKIAPARWLGVGVLVVGLALVAGAGWGAGDTWRGDFSFAAAGLLWAGFTIACRSWGVDALRATAVVAVLGGVASLGLWLGFGDPAAMFERGAGVLATQALVQGVLSGVIAVYAYGRAAAALGAARAAIFAALVPVMAVIAGVPITGEWPVGLQWPGLAIVLAGLSLAMGLLPRR